MAADTEKKQDNGLSDIINGDRIYLRKMTPKDTDQVVAWRNAPHVMERFLIRAPLTRETHMDWIKNRIETGEAMQFIICKKEDDRGIGSFYFRDINKETHMAELGIFIGEKEELGKGYGSESVKLGILYGFEAMGLEKIILRVLSDNQRAIQDYEKNGFSRIEDRTETVVIDGEERKVYFMEKEKEGK